MLPHSRLSTSDLSGDTELITALPAIGNQFLDLIFDKDVVAIYRVVIGDSTGHHKIAELFFENSPGKTIGRIAGFMHARKPCGQLPEDNPAHAAVRFPNRLRGR